jgi:hypothetical protein
VLKNIVFAKNRRMQMTAYLESLADHLKINTNIDVIASCEADRVDPYDFKANNWHYDLDASFYENLKEVVESYDDDDIVLFGVDDVVYTRQFDANLLNILNEPEYEEVLGFSLRLGNNINGHERVINNHNNRLVYIQWDWRLYNRYWSYPWELMASAYRGSIVKDIVRHCPKARIPNDIEDCGVRYCRNNYAQLHPYMMCLNAPSVAYAADLNRVQDLFPNKHGGSDDTTAQNLERLYTEGWRMDYRKYEGVVFNEPFLGRRYFSIINVREQQSHIPTEKQNVSPTI